MPDTDLTRSIQGGHVETRPKRAVKYVPEKCRPRPPPIAPLRRRRGWLGREPLLHNGKKHHRRKPIVPRSPITTRTAPPHRAKAPPSSASASRPGRHRRRGALPPVSPRALEGIRRPRGHLSMIQATNTFLAQDSTRARPPTAQIATPVIPVSASSTPWRANASRTSASGRRLYQFPNGTGLAQ